MSAQQPNFYLLQLAVNVSLNSQIEITKMSKSKLSRRKNVNEIDKTVEIHESFWKCFEEVAIENTHTDKDVEQKSSTANEIDSFMKTVRFDRQADPYNWWSANAKQYPSLAEFANIYLSSPNNSAYSKRLFSETGIIYEEKRNRLLSTSAKKIMSKSKKRSYLDEYMRYGFTYMLKETISYPQCVICYKVLGNDSMKPSKLAIHLNKCHPDLQTKDTDFFKRKFESLKRCKLDKTGIIYQTQQNIVEASYKVSYIIAQNKKAHTLAEEVILPCTKEIVRLLFGEEAAKKVDNISLSNTTVKRRLTDISSNIKENVINEIKESPYFSIQLDESTDFFNDNQLQWKYLFGITTDGAPAMMGCKSGLQTRVKEIAPNVVGVHCFIHRQALATKTLPGSLKTVFNQLVKLVNYIKSSALNTHLFTKFCSDLNAEHNKLLFYTSVRWLSAGNFLERFFMLRNEGKEFLCQMKSGLVEYFEFDNFEITTAYLVDIVGHFNKLNLQLQGKNANVITHSDKLKAFIEKLKLYKTRINNGNLIMFQNLNNIIGVNMLPEVIKTEIVCHLDNLITEFGNYFPDMNLLSSEGIISPFSCDVKNVKEEAQEEFIELKNDTTAKDHFKVAPLNNFWLKMRNSYPLCSSIPLKALIPFSTSYLCEAGFSAMLSLKAKKRNRLDIDADIRCALSKTKPNFQILIASKQCQNSH
nr:protein FAM200A-like [Hydra vulgaris]